MSDLEEPAVETESLFAAAIREHLDLKERNSDLAGEMPLDSYLNGDPLENHPLFKSEEQARIEETLDGEPAAELSAERGHRGVFFIPTKFIGQPGFLTEEQIREVEDFVTLSPDGSRFFTAVPRPDDGRIGPVSFNVDGSGYAMLPAPDKTLQMGAGWWSPDGSKFLVGGWDDTDPSRAGLYTIGSVDGDHLVRLTHPGNPPSDHPVSWSPDGSKVLFIREKPPYDHSGPMNVFVVRKDGSGLVRLNPPGTTSLLDGQSWSPDGRHVAIVASRDGHDGNAVWVVNVDGTGARMPQSGCYRLDGTTQENIGEEPDVQVPISPDDWLAERDPQLDKAIEILAEKGEAKAPDEVEP